MITLSNLPHRPVVGRAQARAGLLGNPSDGYGGKAVAIAIPNFSASVSIEPAECFALRAGPTDGFSFETVREASETWRAGQCEDGLRLLRAAVAQFARRCPVLDSLSPEDPRLRFEMQYATDIPRQVGLAGSSAIVVAALRALSQWFQVSVSPFSLSEWALAAEVDELGLAAGPMDRVIQSFGGLMCMDLREPRSPAAYVSLDRKLLPELFLAWDSAGSASSGRVHGDLRARWRAKEPAVMAAMQAFRDRVDQGVEALRLGDRMLFHRLMDKNFDARCALVDVSARDQEMVALARSLGASAKLCGSGGAIVGMPQDASDFPEREVRFCDAGYRFLRPDWASIHSEDSGS